MSTGGNQGDLVLEASAQASVSVKATFKVRCEPTHILDDVKARGRYYLVVTY